MLCYLTFSLKNYRFHEVMTLKIYIIKLLYAFALGLPQ
jgi:hypothetical protein